MNPSWRTVAGELLGIFVMGTAVLVLALEAGCIPPLQTVVRLEACLAEPPPTPLPLGLSNAQAACPATFAVCLDVPSGQALARRLEASQRWEVEAWIRCGLPDAGAPDAGATGHTR
jgi:hypothetical protein